MINPNTFRCRFRTLFFSLCRRRLDGAAYLRERDVLI